MNISVLLPFPARRPIGGYKIIYSYIKNILKINNTWQCTFYYSVNLLERNKLKQKIKNMYYKFINKNFYCWDDIRKYRNIKHNIGIDFNELVNSDIIIVTSIETAIFLKNHKLDEGKKVLYFIQHFENWNVPDTEVIKSYHFGFKNIVVSKWLKNILIDNGASVFLYLPNPVDEYYCIKIPIQNRYFKSILFMYHESIWKGSSEAIQALKIIKEKYNDVKVSCFSTYKKPKNFPEWIQFYREPKKERLVDLYNQHTLFISSSYKEGYGLPPAEAMACGCSVLTTASGGVEDFAVHNKTAYVVSTPPNPHEIAEEAVSKLFSNRELIYRLSKAGHKKIKQISWEDNANKLLELINDKKQ